MLTMDREKDQITVRGAVDVTKLRSSIKDKFKKDVEVVNTIAVMFPAKTSDTIINKKDESKCGGVMTKVNLPNYIITCVDYNVYDYVYAYAFTLSLF